MERDFSNIIQAGLGLADPKLAGIMAEEIEKTMRPFAGGEWSTVVVPRRQWGMKCHGVPVMAALEHQVRRRRIDILERTMVTHLLKEDGVIAGRDDISVVSRIYDAVADPQHWSGALEAAGEMLSSSGMTLVYGDPVNGNTRIIASTGFSEESVDSYNLEHIRNDELVRESLNRPVGMVFSGADVFPGEEFEVTLVPYPDCGG